MRLSDFDYDLPEEAIARHPTARRDASRLMVVDRDTQEITHATFAALGEHLSPSGDVIALNDSRVLPARMEARKKATGGRVEVLLIEPVDGDERWRVMLGSSKPVREGAELELGDVVVRVERIEGEGFGVVSFPEPAADIAARFGSLPLPPYIDREVEPEDEERYQTVYSRHDKCLSVAAPTAGLHFTPELLAGFEARGIGIAPVTLHVGPGTFLPVRVDDVSEHQMHAETFEISESSASRIEKAERVVAIGTTTTRVLETIGRPVRAQSGRTDIFIRPGFEFSVVGALVTNFHLPRSTLLMLVSAFAGRELILDAYERAVKEGYRFYSYGDAMLIL